LKETTKQAAEKFIHSFMLHTTAKQIKTRGTSDRVDNQVGYMKRLHANDLGWQLEQEATGQYLACKINQSQPFKFS
jgi:hypothetical protein